jgi:hypothetical protein
VGRRLAALAILFAASNAQAEPRDPAAADAHFELGVKARDAGDQATACKHFRESQRLDPAAGTEFNLSACEEALGRVATASHHCQAVIDQVPASDERIALCQARMAALAPRIPKLTIRLDGTAPPGTLVLKDGVELGSASLGLELPIDPGEHVLVVRVPGGREASTPLTIGEGERREVTLLPPPSTPAPDHHLPPLPLPDAPPSSASETSGMSIAGYVLLGVGGATVIAGVITGVLVLDRRATVDEECDEAKVTCRSQEGLDAAAEGRTLGPATTILLAGGGALVVTGILFAILGDESAGVQVSPTGAAFTWSGSF